MQIKPHIDPIPSPYATRNNINGYDVDEWEIEHIELAPIRASGDDSSEDRTAFYSFGTIDTDYF